MRQPSVFYYGVVARINLYTGCSEKKVALVENLSEKGKPEYTGAAGFLRDAARPTFELEKHLLLLVLHVG